MSDPNHILGSFKYRQDQLMFEGAWRFQLVAPLLAPGLSGAEKTKLRQEILSRPHIHPWRGSVTVSARSLRRWCQAYRSEQIQGLKLSPRKDRGQTRRIPSEAIERAKQLFVEDPRRGVVAILRLLSVENAAWGSIKRSTLARQFKAAGLVQDRATAVAYGKFEYEEPNQLWQGDILHGPRVLVDKKVVTAKIVCWLDDYSRYICHVEAFENERLPAIEAALTKAMAKCGRPNAILVDNGKVYSSKTLMLACSTLGIRKMHSRPYHPESKGKQERLFRTLRSQLLNEVENLVEAIPILRLNQLLQAWAVQYHKSEHSEMGQGQTPEKRFSKARMDYVPQEILEEAFLQWEIRRVSRQGRIEFAGNKYWADPSLAGVEVIVRYDPYNLERILLWREGKKLGLATAEQLLHQTVSRPPRLPTRESSRSAERYLKSIEDAHKRQSLQSANLIQMKEHLND